MAIGLALSALACGVASAEPATWGNIEGRVIATSGVPLDGARICLVPERVPCRTTDFAGRFLFSGIPLESWDGERFDLLLEHGTELLRLESLRVDPGATMSPNLEIVLPATADKNLPAERFRIETMPNTRSQSVALRATATTSPHPVFATREGLVGKTTANKHVIVENDHFVALPSRRGMNSNDSATSMDFVVELTANGRRVRLPVWDVGPWNTKDDWWNEAAFRQSFQDLPRGVPQSQAAFRDGHNGGLDGSGRVVKNPAGIDLADGAFWTDLSLSDNATIGVRPLWLLDAIAGDRVAAKHWAKIRTTPKGSVLDTVLCGQKGTVVAGPDSATVSSHWYLFYRIRWDDGHEGWTAENFLSLESSPACEDALGVRQEAHPDIATISGSTLSISPTATRGVKVDVLRPDGSRLSTTRVSAGSSWSLPNGTGLQIVVVRADNLLRVFRRIP